MEKELTLKQKDKLAKKIYKSYQRAQLDILYLSQHYNYYPQIDIFKVKEGDTNYQKPDAMILQQMERKQELENFVSMINQIHSHMSKESYSFIESEYLNFYNHDWWIPYFSRASYYRLKHKVLDELIEYTQSFWTSDDLRRLLK